MERESFQSDKVADILNDNFIPVKVDREERPDIDAIYMNYVQATTGSGGWPLNVFLTPELEPVFGGTYFPGPSHGRRVSIPAVLDDQVGLLDVLLKMKLAWKEQEARCRGSAAEITLQLRKFAEEGTLGSVLSPKVTDLPELELLEEAYSNFTRRYDLVNGGFSTAPKFPAPVNLDFLLYLGQWPTTVKHIIGEEECKIACNMALHTLQAMAHGGIRDQIGYGFSRYSVTSDWSLPHFEKMLYDQALLLSTYLDAFLISGDAEMLGAVYDLSTYLTSFPMVAPKGGFHSSEAADSSPCKDGSEIKHEGAFYVWTLEEFEAVLGPKDAALLARFYGVLEGGNVGKINDPDGELAGKNVLRIACKPSQLATEFSLDVAEVTKVIKTGRIKLREHRDRMRPRPALDDKIIVSWNSHAISALARCAGAFRSTAINDPDRSDKCLNAAITAARFIKDELYSNTEGVLYRVYHAQGGRGHVHGLCEDYAFYIRALLDLYEVTFDDSYVQLASTLQDLQLTYFRDVSVNERSHMRSSSQTSNSSTNSSSSIAESSAHLRSHPPVPLKHKHSESLTWASRHTRTSSASSSGTGTLPDSNPSRLLNAITGGFYTSPTYPLLPCASTASSRTAESPSTKDSPKPTCASAKKGGPLTTSSPSTQKHAQAAKSKAMSTKLQSKTKKNSSTHKSPPQSEKTPPSLQSSVRGAESDLLIRLKQGTDTAEPSANNISTHNLFRLGTILSDKRYVRIARETLCAFEAEMVQFPHLFAGMLGGIVLGRLGVLEVCISAGDGPAPRQCGDGGLHVSNSTHTKDLHPQHGSIDRAIGRNTLIHSCNVENEFGKPAGRQVQAILGKVWARVGSDRTVLFFGQDRGRWIQTKRGERSSSTESDLAVQRSQVKVLVCRAGTCREGIEYLS